MGCLCDPIDSEYSTHARKNGFTWPPNPMQISAWCFTVLFLLLHFGVVSPSFVTGWQPFAYISVGILFVIFIAFHIAACAVDPADDNVRKMPKKNQVPKLDRNEYPKVIEDQYCYVCETNVHAKAKHCALCQKCVAGFDHHCRWLNTCVGKRNYRFFIATMVSAIVGCFSILSLCITLIIAHFERIGSILKFHSSAEYEVFGEGVPEEVWLTLVIFTGTLCIVALVLLLHLQIFHIKLWWWGLSTYEYILQERKKDEERARELEIEEEAKTRSAKSNQVAPQVAEANATDKCSCLRRCKKRIAPSARPKRSKASTSARKKTGWRWWKNLKKVFSKSKKPETTQGNVRSFCSRLFRLHKNRISSVELGTEDVEAAVGPTVLSPVSLFTVPTVTIENEESCTQIKSPMPNQMQQVSSAPVASQQAKVSTSDRKASLPAVLPPIDPNTHSIAATRKHQASSAPITSERTKLSTSSGMTSLPALLPSFDLESQYSSSLSEGVHRASSPFNDRDPYRLMKGSSVPRVALRAPLSSVDRTNSAPVFFVSFPRYDSASSCAYSLDFHPTSSINDSPAILDIEPSEVLNIGSSVQVYPSTESLAHNIMGESEPSVSDIASSSLSQVSSGEIQNVSANAMPNSKSDSCGKAKSLRLEGRFAEQFPPRESDVPTIEQATRGQSVPVENPVAAYFSQRSTGLSRASWKNLFSCLPTPKYQASAHRGKFNV